MQFDRGGAMKVAGRGCDAWLNVPFQGLEEILPYNVVQIRDKDRSVCYQLSKMKSVNQKPSSEDVPHYWLEGAGERYVILSLSSQANSLKYLKITEIYLDGSVYPVDSWQDVLASILSWVVSRRLETAELMDTERLLDWIVPNDPGMDRISAIRIGQAVVRLANREEICKRAQWLLLMCDVNLMSVAVKVNQYSDEDWEKVVKKNEEIRKAREAARLRALEEKRRQEEEERLSREQAMRRIFAMKKHQVPAEKRQGRPRRPFGTHRHSNSNTSVSYSEFQDRPGTYIVEGGVVVFVNRGGAVGTSERTICRSGSDSEDYWKGFGIGAPDNGRFGSIIGEDWAD